jgi:hypothetical protein
MPLSYESVRHFIPPLDLIRVRENADEVFRTEQLDTIPCRSHILFTLEVLVVGLSTFGI